MSDKKAVCANCDKDIDGEVMTAMDKKWHPACFVCVVCKVTPQGQFHIKNDKPICQACYLKEAPNCAACDEPIVGKSMTALGKNWHPEHFVCTVCKKGFEGAQFMESEGKPYCDACLAKEKGKICASCGELILDTSTTAMDKVWHVKCFACTTCKATFGTEPFYEFEGKPYCKLHYHEATGTLCFACKEGITGQFASAGGRVFHPDHFKCSKCEMPLTPQTFREHDNKAMCAACT